MPGPARVQHAHRLAPTAARQATPNHCLDAIYNGPGPNLTCPGTAGTPAPAPAAVGRDGESVLVA